MHFCATGTVFQLSESDFRARRRPDGSRYYDVSPKSERCEASCLPELHGTSAEASATPPETYPLVARQSVLPLGRSGARVVQTLRLQADLCFAEAALHPRRDPVDIAHRWPNPLYFAEAGPTRVDFGRLRVT